MKVRLIVLLALAALMVFCFVAIGHWPRLGFSDGYD